MKKNTTTKNGDIVFYKNKFCLLNGESLEDLVTQEQIELNNKEELFILPKKYKDLKKGFLLNKNPKEQLKIRDTSLVCYFPEDVKIGTQLQLDIFNRKKEIVVGYLINPLNRLIELPNGKLKNIPDTVNYYVLKEELSSSDYIKLEDEYLKNYNSQYIRLKRGDFITKLVIDENYRTGLCYFEYNETTKKDLKEEIDFFIKEVYSKGKEKITTLILCDKMGFQKFSSMNKYLKLRQNFLKQVKKDDLLIRVESTITMIDFGRKYLG